MRVNLQVSFEEKDEAKRLGARWDPARKTWYLQDVEDLTPFMQWITPTRLTMAAECKKLMKPSHQRMKNRKARIDSKPGVATHRTDHSLPDCGCTHVAPWEHCQHTETELALEGAELAHIRSI
jgi:hypothetical protein